MQRWNISDPVDPSLSFDPSRPGCEGRLPLISKATQLERENNLDPELLESPPPGEEKKKIIEHSSSMWGEEPKTASELRFISLQIDIAETLEVIFESLDQRIELARLRYRAEVGPLPDSRKRPRVRLEEYNSYLKVWDFRKQGLTFEQIAICLFPREMKSSAYRSTVTKRVRSQFKRAQKLIEGEYRQIGG